MVENRGGGCRMLGLWLSFYNKVDWDNSIDYEETPGGKAIEP